jgi:hypothetical protein
VRRSNSTLAIWRPAIDLAAEIRAAICAKPNVTPGCSIAYNPLIPNLRRHGAQLLPAIEANVESAAAGADLLKSYLRANLDNLFTLYFQLAQDNGWDYVSFVASLNDDLFNRAVSGIATAWATNNNERRTVMRKELNELLREKFGESSSLLTTLNRLVRIGQLTFDPANPGKKAPLREFSFPILERFKQIEGDGNP